MRGPGFGEHERRPAVRTCLLAVLAAGGAMLAGVAPAGAASNSITLSYSPSGPSGTTPVTITASGSASTGNDLVLVAVVPAASGCPTEYQNPPGGYWINAPVAGGPFTVSSVPTHLEHGSYDICGWLVDQTGPTVVAPATPVPITVSNPDSLDLSVTPTSLTDGGSATVSVSGVSDVDNPEVYVTEKPAADGGCAADPSQDSGTPLADYDPAFVYFGSFTFSQTEYPGVGKSGPDGLAPGRYTLCGWLIDADGSSTQPLAPTAEATVTLEPPTGTLAFSVPELVQAGRGFSIAADVSTDAADVGLYLDLKPLPAHGPSCASSHSLEPRNARLVVDDGHASSTTASADLRSGGVYVACAWLEWPHGTIDGPFAGRLVVLRSHQRPVQFAGGTSQRLRRAGGISFEAVDGQIVNLAYRARFTCTKRGHATAHPIYATTFPTFGTIKGAFADTFTQGSDRATITGRLRGRLAGGTFSESYRSAGYGCRSGQVSFTARRKAAAYDFAAPAVGATSVMYFSRSASVNFWRVSPVTALYRSGSM